jgi:hypothetical protein
VEKRSETLITIDAPHFCAGIVLVDDVVVDAAPIVRYMVGWSRSKVEAYTKKKNWAVCPTGG